MLVFLDVHLNGGILTEGDILEVPRVSHNVEVLLKLCCLITNTQIGTILTHSYSSKLNQYQSGK